MKAKQLEVIKRRHGEFMEVGKTKKPDSGNTDIKLALCRNHPLKLKTRKEIVEAAQRKIVSDRYDSLLQFSDIFQTPPNSAVDEWEKKEADRLERVGNYKRKADDLLTNAELDETSDATAVMDALKSIAVDFGLA